MAKQQIKDYIFKPGISATAYVYPNGYNLLNSNKAYLQAETSAWITQQVSHGDSYTPTGVDYTPSTGVMVLTIGAHNLVVGDVISLADQSLTFTCAMDGHGTQHT